jgi:two-component system, sensor histidine kinase
MAKLIDDLLDVSRITHEQAEIRQRNHRLTVTLPGTPVWLQADPSRLEQVFVNLLANASRDSDEGRKLSVWL